MDFSLLQPDARRRYLRDLLGLKRQWPYYTIMVIDPILRFAWIFYAIFTHDLQHSTIVSFLVAVAEVTRRGMWALIRVENEHCFNVAAYKASRDLPLPYRLDNKSMSEQASTTTTTDKPQRKSHEDGNATASAVDTTAAASSMRMREEVGPAGGIQPTPLLEAGGLRRRRSEIPGARSIRGIMANAHRQDFEKKKRPLETTPADDEDEDDDEDEERDIVGSEDDENDDHDDDDDDDDDESDTASVHDERMQARRTETLFKGDTEGS